jgi:hypothetical protein
MKRLFWAALLVLWTGAASAVAPYITGDRVKGGDVKSVMAQVEKKLEDHGFLVVGRHLPPGVPTHGVVVVTDKGILDAVRQIGGSAIVGAPIRVGIKSDGTVHYANLDYWERAFLRSDFRRAESAVKAAQSRLAKALGAGKPFGGDEKPSELADYSYMWGMERFDSDRNDLKTHASFDAAVKTIQDNLAKGVWKTSKVYEIVIPEKQIAVFGVAMNDDKTGEGWWVDKIGADQIAALPYEIFVVGPKANALYARYRIAIGWPALGMATFMRISDAPEEIRETLTHVAGGDYERN